MVIVVDLLPEPDKPINHSGFPLIDETMREKWKYMGVGILDQVKSETTTIGSQ